MGVLYELIYCISQNHELVKEVDNLNSIAWKCRVNDSKKARQVSTEATMNSVVCERYHGTCASSPEYIFTSLEQSRQTSFGEGRLGRSAVNKQISKNLIF